MRILVLGSAGQLGFELLRAPLPAGWSLIGRTRGELDITDPAAIRGAIGEVAPDLVVNAAAYTAVDRAEAEADRAYAANATAPGQIAAACAERGAMLVHVSTDYVFDGRKTGPYVETDPVNPLGVYGASKEAGERAVRAALDHHVILRTAWVYGAHGHNFVKTMLRLGAERDRLSVVADQRGCPTAAADIATAILGVACRLAAGKQPGEALPWGTYHFVGAGETTWHGFAEAIFEIAAAALGRRPVVQAITTAEYPTPAQRPANSVLDCTRFRQAFGIDPPPWQASLGTVLQELAARRP